jgi:PKD repeat protein
MATTVANGAFDSLAAAVPAPFGPLTRVGSLATEPRVLPNSGTRIAVTGQGSVAFEISYDELNNPGVRDGVIAEAYGFRNALLDLKTFAEAVYRETSQIDLFTGTEAQYAEAMRMFQYFEPIIGLPGVKYWDIEHKANVIKASFTYSGTGASRTFVNTTVGYGITQWFWDFGDGTYSYVEDPAPKTWAADGVKVVRLIATGRGGGSHEYKTSITVDVP